VGKKEKSNANQNINGNIWKIFGRADMLVRPYERNQIEIGN